MTQSLSVWLFLACQAVVAIGAASVVPLRWRAFDVTAQMPPLRTEPLSLEPLYDRPDIASDAQLEDVLNRLVPRFAGKKPRINHIDHALRFWGSEALFDRPGTLSGCEMRDILVNHQLFNQVWGDAAKPLLVTDANGTRVRVEDDPAAASHVDHTVATLAEIGTPLDHPVDTPAGRTTYRSMIEASLRNFSLNQAEHEWSGLTYILWLPPASQWRSGEGQEITFDRLAKRSMRQQFQQGVCFGMHRLFELVAMLQVDNTHDILTDETRADVIEHLSVASRLLSQNQRAEGYWDGLWATTGSDGAVKSESSERVSDRILVTGHALEWLALAPPEVHPPSDDLVRAGQWLVQTIQSMEPQEIGEKYPFLSHAGRALALWRSVEPAEIVRGSVYSN